MNIVDNKLLKININKTLLLLIILISTTRFYNIGNEEVQPWDESMYAVRAKYIVNNNNWIDQTDYSVNGLYSSSHPPLYIWLTALTMKVFGITNFSIRLWSAIFGIGTILLLFYIPKDKKAGFFSSLILCLIPFYTSYSRQGQLDIIYTFFIILGLFFWVKYDRTENNKFLFLTGISFGLSLMSKIIVGLFLPASLFVFLIFQLIAKRKTFQKALFELTTVILIGFVLAFPWHLFMLVKYKMVFLNYFIFFHIIERTIQGVESNTQTLGYFFYINQIIILMPIPIALILFKLKDLYKENRKELFQIFSFFIIPFIVISLSQTKLRTYTIAVLPPLSLLAGLSINTIWKNNKISKLSIITAFLMFFWSQNDVFREQMKVIFSNLFVFINYQTLLLLIILVLLISLSKYFSGRKIIILFLCMMFVSSFTSKTRLYYRGNLKSISEIFFRNNFKKLIYVDNNTAIINPQINYYFNGINLDILDEKYNFLRLYPKSINVLENLDINSKTLIIFNQWHRVSEFKLIEDHFKTNYRNKIILNNQFYRVYIINPN